MSFGPQTLAASLAALAPDFPRLRLAVAVSGGVDSAALLHALSTLARDAPGLEMRALHVDHGLQPASKSLADAAEGLAVHCGVPFALLRVRVPGGGEGLEAEARRARYAALAGALAPREALVLAHHREDQAETLLLQLLRGAGLPGLAGMPGRTRLHGAALLRPLLDVPRESLLAYARAAGLAWCEDPMNLDLRFDRAWLRARLWPLLASRWPAAGTTLARAARHLAEAQALVEERAAEDLARVARGPALDAGGLLALAVTRRHALLRHWLRRQGLRPPAARRLALVARELLQARGRNGPRLAWGDGELRTHDGALYALRPLPPLRAAALDARADGVELGALGRLEFRRGVGLGFALPAAGAGELRMAPRTGGERLRLAPDAPRRAVKDLLRESRLPPWTRERVPLVHDARGLLAVVTPAGTWHATESRARPDEPGLEIRWCEAPAVLQPAPPPASPH